MCVSDGMLPAQGSVKAPRGSNKSQSEGKCEYSLCVVTCMLMPSRFVLRCFHCNLCRTALVSAHETNPAHVYFSAARTGLSIGKYSGSFAKHPQCVAQCHTLTNWVKLSSHLPLSTNLFAKGSAQGIT